MESRGTGWRRGAAVLLALALGISGCPTEADDDTADDDDATGDDDTSGDDDATGDDDTTGDDDEVRLMLHGGGAEDDAVFAPFVEAAGYGHMVTLGAIEDPETYDDLLFWDGYFMELGAASAETVNTESGDDAEDPAAVAAVEAADGVFIRGGDQARYLEHWRGTALHDALIDAWARGAVIGGSSAGCALLGERIYDAAVGSVAAWEALLDPHDPAITFSDDFLPQMLPGAITDTHFTERGRVGRLAVFVERWKADGAWAPLGVGVDPMTALFVRGDGTGEVRGRGSVTLLSSALSSATLVAGLPPDIRGLRLWQLPEGYEVDLPAAASGVDPVLTRPKWATPYKGGPTGGELTDQALNGDVATLRSIGEWQVHGLDQDPDAWRDGGLVLAPGESILPGVLLMTALYEDSDYFENHLGGMMWALAQRPGTVGVGLDIELTAVTSPPFLLTPGYDSYLLVVDTRSVWYAGAPPGGGWLTAALERVTLDVVGPLETWDGS